MKPLRTIATVTLLTLLASNTLAGCHPAGQSVKPGINDRFRGDVDVGEFVNIFEGEDREIFKHREKIADAVGLEPGMSVADVGAGTGFMTMVFAERVGPSGRVFAVDVAPKFLKHIDAQAKTKGLDNIQTVRCKEDSVALPPASVDLVFICDTYHHFEYPDRTMRSIHRALRPDGLVVVVDFRRLEGISREWVLDHVRAGQEETTREIVANGFEVVLDVPDLPGLEENYLIRFRKAG